MTMPASTSDLSRIADGRFWYLASPYTHKLPHMQEQRTTAATVFAGSLMAAGVFVFSPIVQTHRAAQLFSLPGNFEWWLDYNKAFMDASAGTIIAAIDGWRQSRGCMQEVEYTRSQGKPVFLMALDETGSPILHGY